MSALASALNTIERASALLDRTASKLARSAESGGGAEDSVDLSVEMLALVEARNAAAIGVKIAQTVDEMERSTLSVFG